LKKNKIKNKKFLHNWCKNLLVFVMVGCPKEQQSRAAAEDRRAKVSSIHREKVFTERIIIVKLFSTHPFNRYEIESKSFWQ